MFNSLQFVETLSYFQQLLQEGVFDSSISGTDVEENRTLKRLVLQNFSRPTWIEHYKKIKVWTNHYYAIFVLLNTLVAPFTLYFELILVLCVPVNELNYVASDLSFTLRQDIKSKQSVGGKEAATGSNYLGHSNHTPLKRARDTQILYLPGWSSSTFYLVNSKYWGSQKQ